jgi:hypothetical protein
MPATVMDQPVTTTDTAHVCAAEASGHDKVDVSVVWPVEIAPYTS